MIEEQQKKFIMETICKAIPRPEGEDEQDAYHNATVNRHACFRAIALLEQNGFTVLHCGTLLVGSL